MYLIVGLGNPEDEYANTRHNMGFDAINKIAKKFKISVNKNKFDGIYGKGTIGNEEVILLKPQTFMNDSGKSIRQVMNFFKIGSDNLIVIFDDIDIEPGITKVRKKGGPGTHNGMKSVVQHAGTTNFARVRVGIGAPKYKTDIIGHVLNKLSQDDKIDLEKGTDLATEAVELIITKGIDFAMNKLN
ncbi:Peptidyl-tRNA hydrolase [compost metagenome]